MLEARRGYFPPNEIKTLQLHLLPFRDEKFISKSDGNQSQRTLKEYKRIVKRIIKPNETKMKFRS